MPRNAFKHQWSLAAVFLLILGLGLVGCGGKDETVKTDPSADSTTKEPVEDVDLKEGSFSGDELGGGGTEGEDLDAEQTAKPVIVLQDVFFDYDKYDLSDDARAALNQDGRVLRENPNVRILIEGHCDERGTVQYNLALGEKRAMAVKNYLVDLGIAAPRMDTVSYGKEKPFALGHDEAAWAQNRRAHLVVR